METDRSGVAMNDISQRRIAARHLKVAAVLQLIQGVLMEGLPFLALWVVLALGIDASILAHGVSFIVPFFNDHLFLMMGMSGVFAALRIVASIGVLKNRMWGYALSVVNCVVTLVLMSFMLPAGILDGLLAGGALIFLLLARFGSSLILPAVEN